RDQLGQLSRVLEAPGVRTPLGLALRWVSAQGEHVLDSRLADSVEDLTKLLTRGPDTAQVGHGLDPQLLLEPLGHLERLVPGGTAGPVGHRREIGLEHDQRLERLTQVAPTFLALGGEELERENGL